MQEALSQLLLHIAHREVPEVHEDELALLQAAGASAGLPALAPPVAWALLAAVLLSPWPSQALRALRVAGALRPWLPEVDALFGVPQLSDAPTPIDLGEHLLRSVDLAAAQEAPLAVRMALLLHPLGKAGTPREIWPHHYKHEARGHAVLDGLQARLAWPDEVTSLARLAIDEVGRVHRAADVRAGAIAALLERLDAAGQPARFEQLLQVCTLDYAAHPGHTVQAYPKAPRLRRALAGYLRADVQGLSGEAVAERRAQAVAAALRSQEAVAR
jgi:tRNA nucleotidyltransferase (CCA-adding enzyme)